MPEAPTNSPGLVDSLRRLAETLVSIVETRVELVAVEAQQEKARAIITLTLAGAVLFAAVMVGVTLTALIVVVCWAHAALTLAGLAVIYAGGAFLGWRALKRELDKPILPDTIAQLKKDKEWLAPQ
jgi:uncharacterized membrane protein YqjE